MTILRINDPHDAAGGLDLSDDEGDQLTVQGRFHDCFDGAYFIGISADYRHRATVVVPLAQLVRLRDRVGDFIEHQTNDVGGVVPVAFDHEDFEKDRLTVASRHNRVTGGAFFITHRYKTCETVTVAVRIEDLSVIHSKMSSLIEEQQKIISERQEAIK